MARLIVCLTFDFDTQSGFIARGWDSPTPLSRGEFGVMASGRILAMLKARGLPSTWFVPGFTIESHPAACEAVVAGGHEVAHHSWAHVPPAQQSRAEEAEDMARANEAIAKLTGKKARGYRSPSWDLSPDTVSLLLANGFAYESSMMGHDCLPYYARQGDVIEQEDASRFGRETTLVEMPVSWTLDDYPHFEFVRTESSILPGLMNASAVLENWIEDFLYMCDHTDWGVLTYTCHPMVIGRGHRMRMLEHLIARLAQAGAVFLTMEQALEEWRAAGCPNDAEVLR